MYFIFEALSKYLNYPTVSQVYFVALQIKKVKFTTIANNSNKTTTTSHVKSLNSKLSRNMALEIHVMAWYSPKGVAWLNQLMGS